MNTLITCPRVLTSKKDFDLLFKENKYNLEYLFPEGQSFNSKELIEIYNGQEILIVGDDEINEEFLKNAGNLQFLIKWGKGTDNIDKEFCKFKNINVYNSPGAISKYVAEHALALINGLHKKIEQNKKSIQNGKWFKEPSDTLFNKVVGFYGFGAIANDIVSLLKPFNVEIIYHDIRELKNNFKATSLIELFEKSEILIIASDLTKENEGQVNKNLLDKLRKNSILINISRGKIINESDLINILKKKKIQGVGLDVFENEPLNKNNYLIEFDNVLLTCHNASNTIRASQEVNKNIISILETIF